jgi:hypothetical protein
VPILSVSGSFEGGTYIAFLLLDAASSFSTKRRSIERGQAAKKACEARNTVARS